jgi:hypothetical protein
MEVDMRDCSIKSRVYVQYENTTLDGESAIRRQVLQGNLGVSPFSSKSE